MFIPKSQTERQKYRKINGITQEQFDTQLFLGKTLYDLEFEEMFMVGAEGLIRINPRPIVIVPGGGTDDSGWIELEPEIPVEPEPEVPAEPEVEETPSNEEEKTEN